MTTSDTIYALLSEFNRYNGMGNHKRANDVIADIVTAMVLFIEAKTAPFETDPLLTAPAPPAGGAHMAEILPDRRVLHIDVGDNLSPAAAYELMDQIKAEIMERMISADGGVHETGTSSDEGVPWINPPPVAFDDIPVERAEDAAEDAPTEVAPKPKAKAVPTAPKSKKRPTKD